MAGGGGGGGGGDGGGTSWVQIVMSVMTWICAIISLRTEDTMLIVNQHITNVHIKDYHLVVNTVHTVLERSRACSSQCCGLALSLNRFVLHIGLTSLHLSLLDRIVQEKLHNDYDHINNCKILKQNCTLITKNLKFCRV